MIRILLLSVLIFACASGVRAQGCCSGGGSNPLAGGNASGLLKKEQMEGVMSHSFSRSSIFFQGSHKTESFFEKTQSSYEFVRIDYGLTEKLNVSAALGYYSSRKIYEFKNEQLNEQKIVASKGLGDLILLPRFQLYQKSTPRVNHEIDVGIGMKIPIGISNDSNFVGYAKFLNTSGPVPFIDSSEIWHTSPPLVQSTTGSLDMVTSLFYMHSASRNSYFVNILYMHRGWNPLGIKFGDYLSLGVFAGKRVGAFHLMGQMKAEWFGKMKTHDKLDYLAVYNIDKSSTGAKALYFSPQVTYNHKAFRLFVLGDLPLWQNVNGIQAALPWQVTGGVGYRFNAAKSKAECLDLDTLKEVANGLTGKFSIKVEGSCDMCRDRIEKTANAVPGISEATWNAEADLLTFNSKNADAEFSALKSALARVGHDTDTFKADKRVYRSLPECCHYRKN